MSGNRRNGNVPLKPLADDHDFRPKTPRQDDKKHIQQLAESKTPPEKEVPLSPRSRKHEGMFAPRHPQQERKLDGEDIKLQEVDDNEVPPNSPTTPRTPSSQNKS